jgi:hypothetical protein
MCMPTGKGSSRATLALRSAVNNASSRGGRNRTCLQREGKKQVTQNDRFYVSQIS